TRLGQCVLGRATFVDGVYPGVQQHRLASGDADGQYGALRHADQAEAPVAAGGYPTIHHFHEGDLADLPRVGDGAGAALLSDGQDDLAVLQRTDATRPGQVVLRRATLRDAAVTHQNSHGLVV